MADRNAVLLAESKLMVADAHRRTGSATASSATPDPEALDRRDLLNFSGSAHDIEAGLTVAIERAARSCSQPTFGETRFLIDGIIDSLPIGIFVKDMEDHGRYLIYNEAVGKIVGRDPSTVLARCDREVFGPDIGESFIRQDAVVMATGRQMTIQEQPIKRPNGNTLWIRTMKKPLRAAETSKPRYLLGISEDITERRQSSDRLAHMALHDALTDLPNRTLFKDRLEAALAERSRSRHAAVLYLDLDLFKVVNDTYGHHVGDLLLKQVAARLKRAMGRGDVFARLGGDEFAILTRVKRASDAEALGHRLLALFDQSFELPKCTVHVDVSIGIALASSRENSESLLRYADLALYKAKSEGRGLVKIYTTSMSDAVETRHRLTEDLRTALKQGQFELAYQPLLDLEAGMVTGFEALLRWRHPDRGVVPPNDFIPLAEQTGLIVPIGEWVLLEACREAASWPAGVKIAVNLSAVQFRKGRLIASVEAALAASGLTPQRLELEITESVLLTDGENVDILRDLRALGIRIALDDFGTGYSSLSYLRSFPFDKIKMDRSFVTDVCHDAGSLAIVRAVTGLGSSLSITTTAEGIETPEQFAKLKSEGFDEIQGYLIGRPMPALQARSIAQSARSIDVAAYAV